MYATYITQCRPAIECVLLIIDFRAPRLHAWNLLVFKRDLHTDVPCSLSRRSVSPQSLKIDNSIYAGLTIELDYLRFSRLFRLVQNVLSSGEHLEVRIVETLEPIVVE